MQDQEKTRRDVRFMWAYFLFIFVPLILASMVFWGSETPTASATTMQRENLQVLHKEICDRQPRSPICNNGDILKMVDEVAYRHWVPTRLMIWIFNAESSVGVGFAGNGACNNYHNWSGLKGKKLENWEVEWYSEDRSKPDKNGCWLYQFKSFEEHVEALANTLSIGYKWCNMKTVCIAYNYVGHPDKAEQSWIDNVEKFYKPVQW